MSPILLGIVVACAGLASSMVSDARIVASIHAMEPGAPGVRPQVWSGPVSLVPGTLPTMHGASPRGIIRRLPPVESPPSARTSSPVGIVGPTTPVAAPLPNPAAVPEPLPPTPQDHTAAPSSLRPTPQCVPEDYVTRQLRAAGSMALPFPVAPIPTNFQPWWNTVVTRPQNRHARPVPVGLDQLLVDALQYSPHVSAVRDTAQIAQTAITEAESEFDITAFAESKFVRLSDPVGNILTTGGPLRFRDQDWTYDTGMRKKTSYGGSFEASQQLEFQDNNSEFLVPKSQGKARLTLSFTQPLLNGAGRAYNQGRIVLAQFDSQVASDQVATDLTDHLLAVTQAYWDLYLRRASLAQQQRHVARVQQILERLEDRRAVDALQSQVLTASAALATRQANLNGAAAAVRNAEARLRMLVNSPALFRAGPLELIPAAQPTAAPITVDLHDALVTAVAHRPELDQAMLEMKKSAVRLQLSTKELLPVLNAVLETYVAGLQGDARIDQALADQFQEGEPGYTAGLVFEIPLHNRAARSRHLRQQIELRRATSRMQATLQSMLTEVEIAVREVMTSQREIAGWYKSIQAAEADVKYLHDRWELLPGDDRSASFLLEDLLRAQDRLATAEYGFVKAEYARALSVVQLKKAMGTLLCCSQLGGPDSNSRPIVK